MIRRILGPEQFNCCFINSGVEHPEMKGYLKMIFNKYDIKHPFIYNPKKSFFDCWNEFGPLRKSNKWCTHYMKVLPLQNIGRQLYGNKDFLTLIGERKQEGLERRFINFYHRTFSWHDGMQNVVQKNICHPIYNWTQLLLWLYFWDNNIPYIPVYDLGFERLVCMVCLGRNKYEKELVRKHYADEFAKFTEKLPGLQELYA
jgi:phosphoadenosine phosphosulfate reductase